MSAPDVALITPFPAPGERHGGWTGVASYAANLAGALGDAGARVTVVAPQEEGLPSLVRDGDLEVRRAWRRGVAALPAATAAARATGAAAVHLQHELFLYGGPSAVPGIVPALASVRAARRRAIVTMHHVVAPSGVDRDFTRTHHVRAPRRSRGPRSPACSARSPYSPTTSSCTSRRSPTSCPAPRSCRTASRRPPRRPARRRARRWASTPRSRSRSASASSRRTRGWRPRSRRRGWPATASSSWSRAARIPGTPPTTPTACARARGRTSASPGSSRTPTSAGGSPPPTSRCCSTRARSRRAARSRSRSRTGRRC